MSREYIVLHSGNNGSHRVCFDGGRPFVGTIDAAKRVADTLASINPEEEYVVGYICIPKESYVGKFNKEQFDKVSPAPGPKKRTRVSKPR